MLETLAFSLIFENIRKKVNTTDTQLLGVMTKRRRILNREKSCS